MFKILWLLFLTRYPKLDGFESTYCQPKFSGFLKATLVKSDQLSNHARYIVSARQENNWTTKKDELAHVYVAEDSWIRITYDWLTVVLLKVDGPCFIECFLLNFIFSFSRSFFEADF